MDPPLPTALIGRRYAGGRVHGMSAPKLFLPVLMYFLSCPMCRIHSTDPISLRRYDLCVGVCLLWPGRGESQEPLLLSSCWCFYVWVFTYFFTQVGSKIMIQQYQHLQSVRSSRLSGDILLIQAFDLKSHTRERFK